MLHSLVIGFTLALASGADFESLVTAISFHQLFEGLSLGIRIAALPVPPPQTDAGSEFRQWSLRWLYPVLALLFALTTPAGIFSGLIVFGNGHHPTGANGNGVGAKVAEGVLCAVSAGMLIYAACVEMLAADFVLDPTLWRAGKGRQALALASVAMGAAGMVLLEWVTILLDGISFTDLILLSRNFFAIGYKSSGNSSCTRPTIHLILTGFLLQRRLDPSTLHGK
jgi:zinc transporter 1/2/3